jgi:molybdate transport system ATP-binding protein
LARALVQDPDWLLLDELYNGLDAGYRRRIDAVLDAAARRGQSWVVTAHRAADVPRRTRRMLELAQGRVRTIQSIRAADLARLVRRAAENARDQARPRRSAAREDEGGAPVLIRLSQVDLYVEYRPVLRDLDWTLREGEHWAVYGANGAGKSSFLKLLYGDLSPAVGGTIERAGFPRGTHIAEWKRRVGYVSPELQSDYAVDVTLLDLVASGRYASIGLVDEATAEDRRIAARWLGFFGLSTAARRRPWAAAGTVVRAAAPRAHRARHGGRCAHLVAG